MLTQRDGCFDGSAYEIIGLSPTLPGGNVKWLFLAWASRRRWTLPTWPFYRTRHSFLDTLPSGSGLVLALLFWIIPYQTCFLLFSFYPISPHILSLDYLIYTYDFNYFLWPNIFQIFITSSDLSLSYRPIFLIDYGCFYICLGVKKMQIQMRIVLLTNCVTQPNYMTSLSLISTCKVRRILSTSNGFCENLIICENA